LATNSLFINNDGHIFYRGRRSSVCTLKSHRLLFAANFDYVSPMAKTFDGEFAFFVTYRCGNGTLVVKDTDCHTGNRLSFCAQNSAPAGRNHFATQHQKIEFLPERRSGRDHQPSTGNQLKAAQPRRGKCNSALML
jgi:hypothetical protein